MGTCGHLCDCLGEPKAWDPPALQRTLWSRRLLARAASLWPRLVSTAWFQELGVMSLRQRRTLASDSPASPTEGVVSMVKALDVYPKTLDDFKERTGSGAAVSIVSLSIIFLLVISELRAYLTPVTTDHLYVDTTRSERIRINVNMTFPSMPCAGLKCAHPPFSVKDCCP